MFLQIANCHNERVHYDNVVNISLLIIPQFFEVTAEGYEFTFKAPEFDSSDLEELSPVLTKTSNVDRVKKTETASETDFLPKKILPPSHPSTPHSCLSSTDC